MDWDAHLQRIRRAVKTCDRPHPSMKPLTISIGIAVAGNQDGGPEKLLESADAALYTAKRRGRDRVVIDGLNSSRTALPA
ncbi:MAG: diguanylate cyclase [Wenzhouxiangellaceae bacterium]